MRAVPELVEGVEGRQPGACVQQGGMSGAGGYCKKGEQLNRGGVFAWLDWHFGEAS